MTQGQHAPGPLRGNLQCTTKRTKPSETVDDDDDDDDAGDAISSPLSSHDGEIARGGLAS